MRRLLFLPFLISYYLFASPILNYQLHDFSHLMGMEGFSDDLLQIHFKLYSGYVKNANDLLIKLASVEDNSYEYGALKRRLAWEFDGMRLHELYFGNLGGDGKINHKSSLYSAIVTQFGSFEKWKKDFIATGNIRGIGWAVLYLDPKEKRLVNVWINEHDTGHLANGKPILIMDIFEHAYMPQYGLDKAGYIHAFFKNIDWMAVSKRYEE